MVNKCSLDNMLRAILSLGNSESNQTYPAFVFTDQFNTLTSLLLSALVKEYPRNNSVVEMLEPFTEKKIIAVKAGYVDLPDNYRNILGTPSVSIKPDGSDCDGKEPEIKTAAGFQDAIAKSGCKTVPVRMVPISEWDNLTTSNYAFPTYEEPIGVFVGKRQIKVCPYDLVKVEVRYVRQEKLVRYGYITQPDDTYIFDPTTTIESEWTSAAYEPLFKGLMSMYAAYTRDTDMSEWSKVLSQVGIL